MAFVNQDENQEQQGQNTTPSTTAPTGAPSGSAPAASASPANAPKGSGRFTNIQKYIGANQGAGERLATGVGKKVDSKINPELSKSEANVSNLRAGIEAGQNKLATGNQINTQVQDTNFDALGMANDANKLQQFTDYRTGSAIDEAVLKQQALDAQNANAAGLNVAQGLNTQFGTEGGRQELLKQTFSPGRNYSVGQQRLDQLFLSQAAPQMQGIQKNIQTAQNQFGNYGNQLGTAATDVNTLAGDEQTLATNLQSGIKNRETDLVNAVNSTEGAVNAARLAQQQGARDQFGNLLAGKNVNSQFANLVGLTEQDKLYNTLKQDGGIDSYLKFNEANLQGADQLAQQQDRAKYDAIARLAGLDPAQRQINLDTQVANAVDSTGKLRTGIDTNKAAFDQLAQQQFDVTARPNNGAYYGQTQQTLNNLIPLVDQMSEADRNIGTTNHFFYNQNPESLQNLLNQVGGDISLGGNGGSIGLTGMGQDRLRNTTKYQAMLDAYKRMADEGYYQDVNIKDEE